MQRIALTTWSIHPYLSDGSLDLLAMPARIKEAGIATVEICHFHIPSTDTAYLQSLKTAAADAGVEVFSILIDAFDISQAEKEIGAAVEDPNVAQNALVGLAGIGTPSAQRRLTDVALNSQVDESFRQVAANQLAYHIQHYGLMLTNEEVFDLHSGWKNTDNPTIKSALASVIGSLRPNATVISERLRKFPTPPGN